MFVTSSGTFFGIRLVIRLRRRPPPSLPPRSTTSTSAPLPSTAAPHNTTATAAAFQEAATSLRDAAAELRSLLPAARAASARRPCGPHHRHRVGPNPPSASLTNPTLATLSRTRASRPPLAGHPLIPYLAHSSAADAAEASADSQTPPVQPSPPTPTLPAPGPGGFGRQMDFGAPWEREGRDRWVHVRPRRMLLLRDPGGGSARLGRCRSRRTPRRRPRTSGRRSDGNRGGEARACALRGRAIDRGGPAVLNCPTDGGGEGAGGPEARAPRHVNVDVGEGVMVRLRVLPVSSLHQRLCLPLPVRALLMRPLPVPDHRGVREVPGMPGGLLPVPRGPPVHRRRLERGPAGRRRSRRGASERVRGPCGAPSRADGTCIAVGGSTGRRGAAWGAERQGGSRNRCHRPGRVERSADGRRAQAAAALGSSSGVRALDCCQGCVRQVRGRCSRQIRPCGKGA